MKKAVKSEKNSPAIILAMGFIILDSYPNTFLKLCLSNVHDGATPLGVPSYCYFTPYKYNSEI